MNNKNKHSDNGIGTQNAWQKPFQLLMLSLLFLCWLTVGLCYLILPPNNYSASERRKLTPAPVLSLSSLKNGAYLASLENYAKDQFPARELFRSLKTASSLYGFLRIQENGYAVREGHLCLMDMSLNEASVTYACSQIRNLYDAYLADSECRVYYCVIPDKNYYLCLSDPSYPTPDYEAMNLQIHESLEFASPIDIKNDLSLSSFYLTDTHWKQDSLLPAAETILSAMSAAGAHPLTEEYVYETALDRFQGVLCGNMGWYVPSEPMRYLTSDRILSAEVSHLENVDCQTIYDPHFLTYDGPGADPYSFFLSGSSAFLTIKNTAAPSAAPENGAADIQPPRQARELVVFRDSFGSSIAPLFLAGYDQVTLIDTRYINPSLLEDYINFTDQDVLFLYSTLLLNNSFSLKAPL